MNLLNDKQKVNKRLVKNALLQGEFETYFFNSWSNNDSYGVVDDKFREIVIDLIKKEGVEKLIGERPRIYKHTLVYGKSKLTLEESFGVSGGYTLRIERV